MLNKLKLYLILYPILQLATTILIIILLRTIFFCNVVYADDDKPNNPYTKYIVIAVVGVGVMAILIYWFQIETQNNNVFSFSDDISIPAKEYCLDLTDFTINALSTTSQSIIAKPELLFSFCFTQLLTFMREDPNHQNFILDLKSIILPSNKKELLKRDSIYNQILQCYAEMYNQLTDSEKPISMHLCISHLVMRQPNYVFDHTTIIANMIESGKLTEYIETFHKLAKKHNQINYDTASI